MLQTQDGWGWEGSLWLSMGEQIRNGSFSPTKDKMPAEIQTMINYADGKGVKLMGYVYPCLDFVGGSKVPAALLSGGMDLSNREYQTWLIATMLAFLKMSGGGGFAWDHGIFAGTLTREICNAFSVTDQHSLLHDSK